MTNNFTEKLKLYSSVAGEYLNDYIKSLKNAPANLTDSMLYSINAGGKRLRPALLLGTYDIFSKEDLAWAVPYAASIKMIHTYSLIHDDLPSMDNDDLRRGKPSSHMVFGEAGAILAGDALLNSAMENILSDLLKDYTEQKLRAASLIMNAAGTGGMIGGQVLDIEGAADSESLRGMHSMKTGALINASVAAGGILGGCNNNDEKALVAYADNLGCAFQIKDDILDVEGTSDVLGKPAGSDSRNDRITYSSLYGVGTARIMLADYINAATEALSGISWDTGFLRSAAVYIRDRKE